MKESRKTAAASGRATIADVAHEAKVSVATVDRVLNARHKVRGDTARRVLDAARAVGYHAAGLIRQRVEDDLPHYRLGFVLQKPRQHFYQDFAREIDAAVKAATGFRGDARIEFSVSQAPADVVTRLKEVASKSQAVAMVAPDHPTLTAAVEDLRAKGVPVFSLLSDFAPGARSGYVGLDNRQAGRTAAWMIHRIARQPGEVAVFVGSHRFHGHELREIGLRSYFRENAPDFRILDPLVNLETRQITHEATLDLLSRHPDLVGLYVAGGGMEGAIEALREAGAGGRIVAVCNEVTPDSKAALAEGVITAAIATPLPRLCAEVVAMMGRAIGSGPDAAPGQTLLPFDIAISENI